MIAGRAGRLAGYLAAAVGVGAVAVAAWGTFSQAADRQALKSTSLTRVRREALTMFPRGSRLDEASGRLARIGFDCESLTHFLPDVSAPSLVCASSGRGYPDFPAVNLTVVTRNGLIADIEAWNVMARSDDDGPGIDMTATGSIPNVAPEPREPIRALR